MIDEWYGAVIDSDGYRSNVGIILCNGERRLFWGRRVGQDAWQFPQGGINKDETPKQAMYRELEEEVGLGPADVQVVGCTNGWLRYRLPRRFIRKRCTPLCIGQKQIWFLLRLVADDHRVCLNRHEKPEFDSWRWVGYWQPLREVVSFKRNVYSQALSELSKFLFPEGCPPLNARKDNDSPHPRRDAFRASRHWESC